MQPIIQPSPNGCCSHAPDMRILDGCCAKNRGVTKDLHTFDGPNKVYGVRNDGIAKTMVENQNMRGITQSAFRRPVFRFHSHLFGKKSEVSSLMNYKLIQIMDDSKLVLKLWFENWFTQNYWFTQIWFGGSPLFKNPSLAAAHPKIRGSPLSAEVSRPRIAWCRCWKSAWMLGGNRMVMDGLF